MMCGDILPGVTRQHSNTYSWRCILALESARNIPFVDAILPAGNIDEFFRSLRSKELNNIAMLGFRVFLVLP